MGRKPPVFVALAAALTAWAWHAGPSAAAEQDQAAPSSVFGTYQYVGGKAQIDEMNRRIEEGVEELNVFIRGIAERRLRDANRPTEKLTITSANEKLSVARSGKPEMTAPKNGTAVDWKNPENGNELKVSHLLEQGVLRQRIEGDRGRSVNRFVLDEDGKRLLVKTQIQVDLLDAPIRYETTYRRVSPSIQ